MSQTSHRASWAALARPTRRSSSPRPIPRTTAARRRAQRRRRGAPRRRPGGARRRYLCHLSVRRRRIGRRQAAECGHEEVHRECAKRLVDASDRDGCLCPESGCRTPLALVDIRAIAGPRAADRAARLSLDKAVDAVPDLYRCPAPDCGFVVSWTPADGPPRLDCGRCGLVSCLCCGKPWHHGALRHARGHGRGVATVLEGRGRAAVRAVRRGRGQGLGLRQDEVSLRVPVLLSRWKSKGGPRHRRDVVAPRRLGGVEVHEDNLTHWLISTQVTSVATGEVWVYAVASRLLRQRQRAARRPRLRRVHAALWGTLSAGSTRADHSTEWSLA